MLYYSIMITSASKPMRAALLGVLSLLLYCPVSFSAEKSQALQVVTDIPLLRSLVAELVGENGSVTSLISAQASPHHAALSPSMAKTLANADIVVWLGPTFTPALAKSIEVLAPKAERITLLNLPSLSLLPLRTAGTHSAHSRDPAHPTRDIAIDPHVWLDPRNLQAITLALSDSLQQHDAAHAALYQTNAMRILEQLVALDMHTEESFSQRGQRAFIALHDATQYFESRYQLTAVGTLFNGEELSPSIKDLARLRSLLVNKEVTCLLIEPSTNERWIETLTQGLSINVVPVDVLGLANPQGDTHYLQTLEQISAAFARCLPS